MVRRKRPPLFAVPQSIHHTPILTIATRSSPLAMVQAQWVQQQLQQTHPQLRTQLLKLETQGDRFLSQPLASHGGKGLFIKELEHALLDGRADIAVHSMKDMPHTLASDFIMLAICKRHDPRDALLSKHQSSLEALPPQAVIGTASLRRACLVRYLRPDIRITSLRGNVQTRLNKLNDFDAILLAAAGLKRMKLQQHITKCLPVKNFIPAAGQGALGIEALHTREDLKPLIQPLQCAESAQHVTLERQVVAALGAGCHSPLGVHASDLNDHTLSLQVFVGDQHQPERSIIVSHHINKGSGDSNTLLAQTMAELDSRNAAALLL